MRKSIVAIVAVAIIGLLGLAKNHQDGAPLGVPSSNSTTLGQTTASNTPASSSSASITYKDGTYTGASEDTPYGTVQVAAIVSGGKITNIEFLQMPNDRGHTQEVTAFAQPLLKNSTLSKQSAHIDFVSGATTTSEGYQQSLQSALDQAA
jgi:uncharacterized protein with FMN-binding domain